MSDKELPKCGLYKTNRPVGEVPGGRLVYFHNHGNPGPGIYLPRSWQNNRAEFHEHGHTVTAEVATESLDRLAPEGFYYVTEPFHCCDRLCRLFEADSLVQLGYDGDAHSILFVPELVGGALAIPQMGTRIDSSRIDRMRRLKVAVGQEAGEDDVH